MPETLIILAVFVAFAALFVRVRLGTVLGFLIGGAAIGPSGLGLVRELEAARLLAELGVVFLLFNLGLELKIERLRLFGARVYALALTQLLVTGAGIALVVQGLGLTGSQAIVLGGALALSSTAVVLRVIADLGRTLAQLGRVAIAILLVQDLAVGPLLVLVDALGGSGSLTRALAMALAKAVLVTLVVAVVGRYLLRPVLGFIAAIDAEEVFTATAVLLVLGASFATQQAGLSMALGAFVAGLMVADTEYRHQIAADIGPFRGLLLGLFFMTVGMAVDLGYTVTHLGTIVALAAGLLVVKGALLCVLALALRFPARLALELGTLLAQGSEFAFVLLGLAESNRLLEPAIVQTVTPAVVLSMAATALAAALARPILDRLEGPARASLGELGSRTSEVHDHVVIAGFGQVGMALARHLVGLGMPVLVLDYDPKRVRTSDRLPVYFGNAARADVLRAAKVGRARLMIVALPTRTGGERVVRVARALYPKLRLLARVPDEASAAAMRAAGADAVVVEGLTTARDLAERAVLLYDPGNAGQSQRSKGAP